MKSDEKMDMPALVERARTFMDHVYTAATNKMRPEDMGEFGADMLHRLSVGEAEYAGTAMERPGVELAHEVAEECSDVAGWSFWLWHRALKAKRADLASEWSLLARDAMGLWVRAIRLAARCDGI